MPYPQFRRSRSFKFITYTGGNVAFGVAISDFATATDLTLDAQIGDVVEVGISAAWSNEAQAGYLDVATIVSNAVVNYYGTLAMPGIGISAWYGVQSSYSNIGGSFMRTLASADVSANTVTVRLRGKATGASKTLLATASDPVHFWAKNLGPVQP